MMGELDPQSIDQLLRHEMVGRIGCYAEGRSYVVPINYVYDGEYIYARSVDGKKLHMMRLNPEVCFEVEHIDNLSNWQSVIAWGTFEELQDELAAEALYLLTRHNIMHIASGQSVHHLIDTDGEHQGKENKSIVIYRIRLTEKTGQFEKTT